MVAKEFLNFYKSIAEANRFTLEDIADRLNLFTAILFLISCLLVTTNQYLLKSIACYIPVKPTGDSFSNYLTDYCWVHGTIPLRADEKMPSTEDDWSRYDSTRRITYYQWVPFILGLQCLMFYIPHIFWQSLCSKQASGDLFALVKVASSGATDDRKSRQKKADQVAEFIEDMLGEHQPCRKMVCILSQNYALVIHYSPRQHLLVTTIDNGNRDTCKISVAFASRSAFLKPWGIQKPGRRNLTKLAETAYKTFGVCIPGKRLGTRLVFSYLVVKVVTLVNVLLQIFLIQRFLGFYQGGSASHESMNLDQQQFSKADVSTRSSQDAELYGYGFGITVLKLLLSGKEWPETLLFPRITHCYVGNIQLVGVKNMYTAQCALPVNMINEKLYVFFWFWLMFMLAVAVYSTIVWLIRIVGSAHRKDFIKRYLRLKDKHELFTRDSLKEFIDNYLRQDGVFLLRMLALNAGDVMAGDVTGYLYDHYVDKHRVVDTPEKAPLDTNHSEKYPKAV